jgi:sugar/nucleoside kinase (ribokinase family)
MSMNFDVITIGAAVRDVYVQSDAFHVTNSSVIPGQKDACFVLGGKIEVDAPFFSTGGGATNAAATFAHLGFKAATICKIGNDRTGKDIVDDLEKHGIFTDLINTTDKDSTGYSTLLTTSTGRRTAIVYRGASSTLCKDDLPKKFNAPWIYLTSLGGNIDLANTILDIAIKSNSKISWNPGSKELEYGISKLTPLFKKTNVLHLNREEAVKLTKVSRVDTRGLLHKVASSIDGIFVMTDGPNGAFASNGQDIFREFPTNAPVINATGSGDAFGSGFVAGLIEWPYDITNSLRLAALNAESVIGQVGAKNGILPRMPGARKLGEIRVEPYNA